MNEVERKSFFSEVLATMVEMSALEERVVALNVCPFCHSKTLIQLRHTAAADWKQCAVCRKVFVVEAVR